MPSLSGFLRSPRAENSQLEQNSASLDNGSGAAKAQGKASKRGFFRNLLKRSNTNSENKRGSIQFSKSSSIQPIKSPEPPTSPMADPNKPLPPPPSSENIEPDPISPRPVKNLQRIISPITLEDLHKLFSGAPQFFARSLGEHTGAPHPSVAFPWDSSVHIRDLTDHIQINDQAWSSITAWPHLTRDVQRNADAVKEQNAKRRARFLPRCRERPNMLSMQGIERGTIGYAAALESAVADALNEQNFEDTDPVLLSERREMFLNGKTGIRHLSEATLLDLLRAASKTYHGDPAKHQSSNVELYSALFTRVLFPPSRVTDSTDPYSLRIQIEALIEVLTAKDVWVDFTLVEWRIRLGRILWGPPEPESADDIVINSESTNGPRSQRYWLLLQILISSELLLRLDAIARSYDLRIDEPNPAEITRINKLATISGRWSLMLARYWLENIQIVKTVADIPETKPATAGWVATLTERVTGIANPVQVGEVEETLEDVHFEGIHQERQLNGLLHFGRKLNWPNIEALASKIQSNGITLSDTAHSTPATGTPLSNHRPNSYFPASRPGLKRGISRSRTISALMRPAGWLSNSYISGLVLPGEGLNHFLISTLLENDSVAVSKLGQDANLYGGFVYSNLSFWSTSCILGRVLAGGKGATECIGWISSGVVPRGVDETWVNIDAEYVSTSVLDKNGKPRIWHKTVIEHDGNVIGGADVSSVLPGDFILPSEESIQNKALSIKLESLDLLPAIESVHSTPSKDTPTPLTYSSEGLKLQTYSAMMRFSVDVDGEDSREVSLELRYNVNFVTAFPCISSQHIEILKSPTSPSFQSPQHSPSIKPRDFTGHPLHKAFTYSRIPLSALLTSHRNYTLESLLSPISSQVNGGPTPDLEHSSKHTTNSTIPKVLVIDCIDVTTLAFPIRPTTSPQLGRTKPKFGSDLAMLARGLCAERGWNALVSRRGRGCLACAIREAGALGWRVVLRIV